MKGSPLKVSGNRENREKYSVCPLNASASKVIANVLFASGAV